MSLARLCIKFICCRANIVSDHIICTSVASPSLFLFFVTMSVVEEKTLSDGDPPAGMLSSIRALRKKFEYTDPCFSLSFFKAAHQSKHDYDRTDDDHRTEPNHRASSELGQDQR